MSVSQADVVGYIKNLKLGEVQNLVTVLEDELGVLALAPVPSVFPAPDHALEVQTEFDVRLVDAGASRIKVIKAVRKETGLGLKEAKGLVESVPAVVREGLGKHEAEALAATLQEAGATVEVV